VLRGKTVHNQIPIIICAFIWLISLLMYPCSAHTAEPADGSPLLSQDVPIYYGEEDFIKRMNELPSGRTKPLGLLLSGGSARAFAHIGVLKALDENGLSPDFIVTNSMGSIVGLLYGAGISPDTIQKLISQIDLSTLFEPEIPMNGGLLNTRIFTELIDELVAADDIKDLPIPVIVICEDLISKRTVVLAEGNIEKVLAASFALPVYFNPIDMKNHRLIDGGVSNIVPVAFPYRYTDDVIVSTTFYSREMNLKNPLTILNVAMDITKTRAGVTAIKKYDPIWVRCDVESFSFMDWKSLDDIVLRGYNSTLDALAEDPDFPNLEAVSTDYLSEIRAEPDIRLTRGYREYMRTGVVNVSPFAWGVKAGPELDGGPEHKPLMQSRNRFSLGPYLQKGYGEIYFNAFYQPEWLNEFQLYDGPFWGAAAGIRWMPGRRVLLDVATDFMFSDEDSISEDLAFSSMYLKSELRVPLLFGNGIITGPFVRTEFRTDNQFNEEEFISLGGLYAGFQDNRENKTIVKTEAGFYSDDDTWALQNDTSIEIPILPCVKVYQRLFTRYGIGDSAHVPYFAGDYYRGSKERELLPHFLIGNSSIAFSIPDITPTFGETLILEYFSIGPFYDFRMHADGFEYIAGGALEGSLSIIGLKPLIIHADYGWKNDGTGIFSLYFGM